jgi:hypothetical protein
MYGKTEEKHEHQWGLVLKAEIDPVTCRIKSVTPCSTCMREVPGFKSRPDHWLPPQFPRFDTVPPRQQPNKQHSCIFPNLSGSSPRLAQCYLTFTGTTASLNSQRPTRHALECRCNIMKGTARVITRQSALYSFLYQYLICVFSNTEVINYTDFRLVTNVRVKLSTR